MKTSPIFQRFDQQTQAVVTALVNDIQNNRDEENSGEEIIAIRRLLENFEQHQSRPQALHMNDLPLQTEEELRNEASQTVLQQLQYEVMNHRVKTIKSATTNSCKWIWDEKPDGGRSNLADWLVSGTGVYLIAGNEGSGKSTLMKYLFHQQQTFELLNKWASADSVPLATAAFFFWRNGTQLEKSEEGLLRSILFSVLSQQPHIIPSVLPGIYAKIYSSRLAGNRSHTGSVAGGREIEGLRKAFTRLIRQTQSPIKLFFLIDGIDEYQDDQDNRRTMIELLTNEITASTNAKAIIASRKLDDMDNLGIKPSLTLHDSNHVAIHTYVEESLGRELKVYATKLPDDLSDQITSSAKGNFLWASLMVANISSQMLVDGCSVDEIESTPKGAVLTSGIHDLYEHMWSAIPEADKRRASEILQIVLIGTSDTSQPAVKDIRLVDLMFALGHPKETIESEILEWHPRTIEQKCKETAESFLSIWPGFLTAENDNGLDPGARPDAWIQYCHRSVPEYFLSDAAQQNLKEALGSQPFCPHMAHLKSAVQHLKALPLSVVQDARLAPLLWEFVTRALLSSNRAESSPAVKFQHQNTYQELLQQLDRTMSHHHRIRQQKESGGREESILQDAHGFFKFRDFGRERRYLASLSWVNFHPTHSHPRSDEDSFLSLAIQFGLKDYLGNSLRLNKKTLKSKKGRPLLDYALYPSPIAAYDLISPEVVQTLLEYGADPNEEFETSSRDGKMAKVTCWEHALMWQYETYKMDAAKQIGGTTTQKRQIAERRLQIMKILMDRGAKIQTEILVSTGKRLTARDALQDSFRGWVNEEKLGEVMKLYDEAGSSRQGIHGLFKR